MKRIDKLNIREVERINILISKTINKEFLEYDLQTLKLNPKKYWNMFDLNLPCEKQRKKVIQFMQNYYNNL